MSMSRDLGDPQLRRAHALLLRPDQDVEPGVHLGGVAGQDDRGGVELGDHRRPGEPVARREAAAVVDGRRPPLALEEDLAAVGDRPDASASPGSPVRQLGRGPRARADGAQVDDLRRRVGHAEAVEPLVQRVEALVEDAGVALHRHRDLVALAVVAHVRDEGHGLLLRGESPPRPSTPGRAARAPQDPRHLLARRLAREADQRLRELVAEVGDEVAERAQQPGRRRHDHREGAHQLGDRVRVQRPRAAEGDERELARVVPALDGDDPQGARHVLVDDLQDALRRLVDRQADGLRHLRDGGARRLRVERHLAADQARRQVADDDVGVRDRRRRAALAVGRRARAPRRPTPARRAARA